MRALCKTKRMAQAAAKYVLAALLALLATQVAAPSVRSSAAVQVVWCADAQQESRLHVRQIWPDIQKLPTAPGYVSRIVYEPLNTVLFQRPPPALPLYF